MKAYPMSAYKPMLRIAQIATAAVAFSVGVPRAVAAEECAPLLEDEGLKGLYDKCILVLDLETFSRAWSMKQGWKEAGDYSTAAIHTIDYLIKKVGSAPAGAAVSQQMTQKRAELEKIGKDCAEEIAGKKQEDEKRGKVLVNLRIPAAAPNVFVNGNQVTGPVYVPKGTVILGVGEPGGGYDEGKLSGTGEKLEVQVTRTERAPQADPAAKEMRGPALDFSLGPIVGGRYIPWDDANNGKAAGLGGFRGEVTLPDLVTSDTVRLRPVMQYSFEHGPPDKGWTVHNGGLGLKLTLAKFFEVGLTGGISRINDPSYKQCDDANGNQDCKESRTRLGGYGPELSLGLSHTVFNATSMNGPKLGIGASVASGISFWLDDPSQPDHHVLTAPYIHGGVFLRLRFGRSRPPRPPSISDMVHFNGGPVPIGWEHGYRTERPAHFVLLGSFDLDVKEVTVAGYRVCVDAGKCKQPGTAPGCNWDVSGRRNHPINCVSREQASNYCGFVGKRLPTESEWEHAARGARGRKYPWGDKPPTSQPCWNGSDMSVRSTCEVGSHPEDRTPDGVLDLAGNVSEWTGQYCDYLKATCRDVGWVSRGGSFGHVAAEALRSSARYVPKEPALETVGFRCAR